MTLSTHGPVVLRRRLGAELRRLRGEHGLQLDIVARQLEISPSKLSRLETGLVEPKMRDVRDLLDLYEAPAELAERMMRLAAKAKEPGWWQPFSAVTAVDLDLYISLEMEAYKIRMFSLAISGLLQTKAYARMLLAGAAPTATSQELEQLVEIRVRRQSVLDPGRADAPPTELHALLDEHALRRCAGPEIMREQLEDLLRRAEWPNVTLQILPFDAGYTRANGTFVIFEPREPGDGAVVNVESAGRDAYLDTSTELAKYDAIWMDVLDRCLDPDQSRAAIERMLREGR
jgi:transcriptional regulator with XRE-family HTH domain